MQTFVPFSTYEESAKCLDMRRLGKQRVECLTIMRIITDKDYIGAWVNHPAVRMWEGSERALLEYSNAICDEWTSRGYKDTCKEKINDLFLNFKKNGGNSKFKEPIWFGDEEVHKSHREALLYKDEEHYRKFFPNDLPNLNYIWPTDKYRL